MRLFVFLSLTILLTFSPVLAREPQAEKGSFLVASESITDPRFAKAVILLIKHDSTGSLGLIINKPTGIDLNRLFTIIPDSVQTDNIFFVLQPKDKNVFTSKRLNERGKSYSKF